MSETVGILIPTFNRLGFLRIALETALAQSWQDIRVLVIDNGSTDGTAEFMAGVHDDRVSYTVNDKNLGPLGSFNKGIGLFPPEVSWCVVLCDDDLLAPDFVAEMLRFFQLHPCLNVAYSRITFIDGGGAEIRDGRRGPDVEAPVDYLRHRAFTQRETYLSALMFRRDAFDNSGGYPIFTCGWGSDDGLIFSLGRAGGGIGYVSATRTFIRIHEGSQSIALPGGIVRQFRSYLDLKSYCSGIACRHGDDPVVVSRIIDRTIRYWIYRIVPEELMKVAALSGDGTRRREVDAFFSSLHDLEPFFPSRILIDRYLARWNCWPEKLRLYRFFWQALFNLRARFCK